MSFSTSYYFYNVMITILFVIINVMLVGNMTKMAGSFAKYGRLQVVSPINKKTVNWHSVLRIISLFNLTGPR